MKRFAKSEGGYSLVGMIMLVAAGLVVSISLMSGLLAHRREVRRLELKIALKDIEADAKRALSSKTSCVSTFAPPFQFDSNRIFDVGYGVNLNRIADGTGAVVRSGENLLKFGRDVSVSNIRATGFKKLAGDIYSFNLVVTATSSEIGTVANVSIEDITVATDSASPAAAKTVLSCGLSSANWNNCHEIQQLASDSAKLRVPCGSHEQVSAGYAICYNAAGKEETPEDDSADVGFLVFSSPYDDGTGSGWEGDCDNLTPDRSRVFVSATCCRR